MLNSSDAVKFHRGYEPDGFESQKPTGSRTWFKPTLHRLA